MGKKRRSTEASLSEEGTNLAPWAAKLELARLQPRAEESDVPLDWSVGDVLLDLYEVKQIHEGGPMGLVYRVRHRTWNVDLAVKSPRPEYFRSETNKQEFEREAETWVDLGLHPHVVSCHYVRRLGGIPRVFVEYVEGGSLSQWIRDGKLYRGGPRKALQRILDIAVQMAWGLQYAHDQGLVHQNLKPANVMLTSSGVAKVTDFGLAKARAATGEVQLPPGRGGVLVSWGGMTPAYASPEQVAREKLSRRTDVWSWAVSVFEMFSGGVTWGQGSAADTALDQYLEREPERDLPTMPEGLVAVLRRCLAREPQERPKDIRDVATQLQEVYGEAVGQPHPGEARDATLHVADRLSNRALEMLDLGKIEEAEHLWEEALKAVPHHLHATYNRGVHRARTGRMTDEDLIQQVEAVRARHQDGWVADYLLGLAHAERGDLKAAAALLEESSRAVPEDEEVAGALEAVRTQQEAEARCLCTLQGHTHMVRTVAMTPDSRFALSGSDDGTLRLWELATGRCLRTLHGHKFSVNSVAVTADARFAVSGSEDKTLRLWELATGRCLRTLKGHKELVVSVALSRDSRLALSGSHDGTVRVWELATGRCVHTLEGHTDRITQVALTPDGSLAISGSWDKTLRLWDLATGRSLCTLRDDTGKIWSAALTADGRFALSGSYDGTLRLWELATGRCLGTLHGHIGTVWSVAVTPDSRFALSGGLDKTLRLWDLATGRCLRTLEGHTDTLMSVALTSDARVAVSGSLDKTLRLWELGVQERRAPWSCARLRASSALTREAALVRQTLDKARSLLADSKFGSAAAELRMARGVPGYERSPELLENWHRAGRGGRRAGLVGAWHARSLHGHTDSVISAAITPDGDFALSGSLDGTLRLWELATGRCLRTLECHPDVATSVAVTADARFALSTGKEASLRLWELATGRCLGALDGHTGIISSAATTGDGRFVLSGSDDRTLRLWELATGRCVGTLEGLMDRARALAVTAEGDFTISGRGTKTLRLWDLSAGQCRGTLEGHTGTVMAITMTEDGRFVLSGSEDKTLRLWELDWDYQFPDPADWDEGARPYVETFLVLHSPYAAPLPEEREPSEEETRLAIIRRGAPSWTEESFQGLIQRLQNVGYGWLRPEGVRAVLERMSRNWDGSLPFEAEQEDASGSSSFLSRLFRRSRK